MTAQLTFLSKQFTLSHVRMSRRTKSNWNKAKLSFCFGCCRVWVCKTHRKIAWACIAVTRRRQRGETPSILHHSDEFIILCMSFERTLVLAPRSGLKTCSDWAFILLFLHVSKQRLFPLLVASRGLFLILRICKEQLFGSALRPWTRNEDLCESLRLFWGGGGGGTTPKWSASWKNLE